MQVIEDIRRSSVADFSHLSAPVSHVRQPQQGLTELPAASAVAAAPAAAAAQASSAAAAAPEVAQSPRRSLRSPQSFQAADAPPAVEAQQDGAWTGITPGLSPHCHLHTDTYQSAAAGVGGLLTLTIILWPCAEAGAEDGHRLVFAEPASLLTQCITARPWHVQAGCVRLRRTHSQGRRWSAFWMHCSLPPTLPPRAGCCERPLMLRALPSPTRWAPQCAELWALLCIKGLVRCLLGCNCQPGCLG